MANPYILLTTSDSTIYKFRCISGDVIQVTDKSSRIQHTIGGVDIQHGTPVRIWPFTIKVYETDPDPTFANLADLRTLYRLNNPNGTPSSNMTMTYFDSTTYTVTFIGQLQEKAITSLITGTSAIFFIPVKLIEVV